MAYWLTLHFPFVPMQTDADVGVFVRPGLEAAAKNLAVGDLVFVYETRLNDDTGERPGAMAVLVLVRVRALVRQQRGNWIRVASTKSIAFGHCSHGALLQILKRKRIQSMGPMNSKLLPLKDEQFNAIADYFPDYKTDDQRSEEEAAGSYQKHKIGGQAFASKELRDAVERYAMEKAKLHYESQGWDVQDRSKFKPFDLFCRKDEKELFVEVKGTTGDASSIILTNNEVRWENEHHRNMVLFLLHSISLGEDAGLASLSGGSVKIIESFEPRKHKLEPICYKCIL